MSQEDVEKEIRELEKQEQIEKLRRLRARQVGFSTLGEGSSQGTELTRTMVSARILPPPELDDCSTYDMYKKKLQLWEFGVDLPKKKKAAMIIQSLTNHSIK